MEDLRARLSANLNDRGSGGVLCGGAPARTEGGDTDEDRICAFLLGSHGLDISPGALRPISRREAAFIAAALLRGPVWAPRTEGRDDAQAAASKFLGNFAEAARFFSTYSFKINQAASTYTSTGSALLDSSFDMGVLVADDESVGVLWMGDED